MPFSLRHDFESINTSPSIAAVSKADKPCPLTSTYRLLPFSPDKEKPYDTVRCALNWNAGPRSPGEQRLAGGALTVAMPKSYITIAWRNLLRNKLASTINIGGLTIGPFPNARAGDI